MKIGTIDLGPRPLLLAPMEDVTDIGFRLLCRKLGAAMVYSEFVAADALVRMVNKSLQKLTVCDEERPVAIQIYGKDPAACAEAAQIVVERAHPDVLDINFGCPVKRVAGKGAGAGLLQDVPRMLDIARWAVHAVNGPVPATGSGLGHTGTDHSRTHSGANVHGLSRLEPHCSREAQPTCENSHHWQRRPVYRRGCPSCF